MAPVAIPVASTKTATAKAGAVESAAAEASPVEPITAKASAVGTTTPTVTASAVPSCPSGVSERDRYDTN